MGMEAGVGLVGLEREAPGGETEDPAGDDERTIAAAQFGADGVDDDPVGVRGRFHL